MRVKGNMRAEARYIRISPQKARLVVDLIRGRSADAARLMLRTVNKRIAPSVLKVLESAISNARNAATDLDVDNLGGRAPTVHEGRGRNEVGPARKGRAARRRG